MTRVLIDENLSPNFARGLNIIQQARQDEIIIEALADVFQRGVKDEDWIPVWGKHKGIFISQDIKITTRKQQVQLLNDYQLGAFFLDVPKNYKYWDRVKIIINEWLDIVEIIKSEKRPFAYKITPRKIEKLSL